MKTFYLLPWIVLIFTGCSAKDLVEYEREDIILYGYQEAPIGGITFTLLKSDTFNVESSGLFTGTKFWGTAIPFRDSIALTYFDKTIDFDSIPLPQFFVIDTKRLKTKLRDRKYYLNIGKNELEKPESPHDSTDL